MEDIEINAGKRIRLLREKSGLSREKCSELAGIGPKFLYEIECGKKGMSAATLYRLATVFGVSSDYLLTGKDFSSSFPHLYGFLSTLSPEQKENAQDALREISIYLE